MDVALKKHLQTFVSSEREERMQEVLKMRTKHLSVVLENLSNPQNASAIVRTLDCFGVQDLHVIENHYSFQPDKIASKGTTKWVSIHQHQQEKNNTVTCLRELKEQGYKIVATSPHTDKVLADVQYDQPVAFVFGNEHDGITEFVKQEADELIKLPMYGFAESFNISVTVAMVLQQARIALDLQNIDWKVTEEEKIEIYNTWLLQSIKHADKISERFIKENP